MSENRSSDFEGGPLSLILDFTTLDLQHINTAIQRAFNVDDRTDKVSASSCASDLTASLSTFGLLHRMSSGSGLCDDGCVPTAVIGLFTSNAGPANVETVWLYNSLDEESTIATGPGTTKRVQRLWTSNRHFETGVLPIIVGTLRSYVTQRIAEQSEDDTSNTIANATGRDLRACQGAIMKALCFLNQHKDGGDLTKVVTGKASAVTASRNRRREALVQLCLLTRSSPSDAPAAGGSAPSVEELAQSVLALQLESSNTRLYLGLGEEYEEMVGGYPNAVKRLSALSYGSRGACGWLRAHTNQSGPTLADHLFCSVSDNNENNQPSNSGGQQLTMTSNWMKYALHDTLARRADLSGVSYIDTETLCLKE